MTALSFLPPPVHSYISDFVARARRLATARAVGLAAAIFVGWRLACCALDRFAQFNGWTRLGLLASGLLACAVLVLRPLLVARRRTKDALLAATEIERHDPRFGQRLVTVVSRLMGPTEHRGSEDILYRLLNDVSHQAGSARRPRPIPLRRVIRPWLALAVLVALGTYLARQPDFGLPRLLLRYAVPLAAVEPVTTTRLVVTPGDTDVEQSRPLRIEVTAHRLGEGRTVWVWLSENRGEWVRRPMN